MKTKALTVFVLLAMLFGLLPGAVMAAPTAAQVVVPVPGPALNIDQMTVNDGPGGQTDPHISGDLVSYTDNSIYRIRLQNLAVGVESDGVISVSDDSFDSVSDINGDNITFMRTSGASQRIYLVQHDNPIPAVEVSPLINAQRRHPVIGGSTIAYQDLSYGAGLTSLYEISLSNAVKPDSPAIRLTEDELADVWPAVSPDGSVVVWIKCPTTCTTNYPGEIWRAERTEGVWGVPEKVTGYAVNRTMPDTNGPVTVYSSVAGAESDIYWSVKNSSGTYIESVLALPGEQRNPNIAGDYIVFEGNTASGMQFDLYLYDLVTNRLYQLTKTAISESLSDISTGSGGLVRVVWAQPKTIYPYDMDVYAMSFVLDTTPPVTSVTGVADGATYDLGSVPQAGCSSTDDMSGVSTEATLTLTGGDEQGVGVFTATCSGAQDAAGNVALPVVVHYTVVNPVPGAYSFTGFFQPVDNPGEGPSYVFNSVKAGSAIPVKFSLNGNQGLSIFASGSPTSKAAHCSTAELTVPIDETVVASNSSLSYNATTDTYTYVWKTDKSWRGTCRLLNVKLSDGSEHLAYFQFK
jgi:hypothetical protein